MLAYIIVFSPRKDRVCDFCGRKIPMGKSHWKEATHTPKRKHIECQKYEGEPKLGKYA